MNEMSDVKKVILDLVEKAAADNKTVVSVEDIQIAIYHVLTADQMMFLKEWLEIYDVMNRQMDCGQESIPTMLLKARFLGM